MVNIIQYREENAIQRNSGCLVKFKFLHQIPNAITIFRIIIAPLFIYFLFGMGVYSIVLALILFILASVSDYFDGYFARKYNIQSRFGEFLDPAADKIIVGGAFISFTIMPDLYVPIWLVIIILFRELFVTSLRIIALNKGKPIKTEYSGKIKTAFQMFTIILILILIVVERFLISSKPFLNIEDKKELWVIISGNKFGCILYYIPLVLVSISAVLAFISLIKYFIKNYRVIFS